jgi:hypothetical protein
MVKIAKKSMQAVVSTARDPHHPVRLCARMIRHGDYCRRATFVSTVNEVSLILGQLKLSKIN